MANKQQEQEPTDVQDWRVKSGGKRLPLPKACWQDPSKDAFSGNGDPYHPLDGIDVLKEAQANSD
ncbi:MAG: hypothetical protein ACRELF_11200 [Gemmataceae bacterium]